MDKQKYELFLRKTNHTEKSIQSRIVRLKKIENIFCIDIDSIIYDKSKVIEILSDLKKLNVDTVNQNLSNAIYKYYECCNGNALKEDI